ncbi:MAG TPA: HEAT repeat domain-containing protein [Methylomirabilota bacterium]|nr:HEAT repeat domain-containing protein [Methylomirabilota bacterium]
MWKFIGVGICLLALTATALRQGQVIRELRRQAPADGIEAPRPSTEPNSSPARDAPWRERVPRAVAVADEGLNDRVAVLEKTVAKLTEASEYLMSRGQLPLANEKRAALEQKVMDPNASDRDRLQALRLLRRNGAMSDAMIQHTLSWIQGATNSGLREDLVEQLGNSTNSLMREPMLKLATTDPNPDVREQAIENLRRFVTDPQVESALWSLLRTEADGDVREQAEEALREGPMTEARQTAMRARAIDPNSSLDERLLAVQALREAGDAASEATAALAQFAQASQDPRERARVFEAFDGSSDPNMKLPLVYGLQDPNPLVRESAADALSGYKSDPAIMQWLKHVAENDADPRVRREASQSLNDRR